MRVHMYMFVEQLTSRDPVRTRLGKQLLSVDEFYPGPRCLRHRANNLVNPIISTEAQSIQVSGEREPLLRHGELSERPVDAANSILQFSIAVVYSRGRQVAIQRLTVPPRILQRRPFAHFLFPSLAILRRKIGTMERSERSAVLQVHPNGADQDPGTGTLRHRDNVT